MRESTKRCTSIGGQAVLEGVMMRGPHSSAIAVRTPDGNIDVSFEKVTSVKDRYPVLKLPVIRGVVNFVEMLVSGYQSLSHSAKLSGLDELEEESRFEKWLAKRFGGDIMNVVMVFSMVLGVLLAVGLFTVLPAVLVGLLGKAVPAWAKTLLEGLVKIAIFVAYLALVSRMKDIRRVFEYHGAEHKSIFCYENDEELTVENVRRHSRFHPRCGTSFLLIVLVISILVFSMVSWDSVILRVVLKIVLLPVVVGVSYEIIKYAGRHENALTRILSAPGLWLQRLTTCEPDDSQIEVAIAALKPVVADSAGEDIL